jgi:hypothetical protein
MFRVYVTFKTGDRHLDTEWCDDKKMIQSLYRLIHGPVARLNIIKEIRREHIREEEKWLRINGRNWKISR